MSERKFVIGLDYGTESGRALIVDVATGEQVACAVTPYPDGVIDEKLPGSGIKLAPEWVLQNPDDYLHVLKTAVPQALREGGVQPEQVIGIGVDFTACTILPTLADGTPLCRLEKYRQQPHAWTKLWKHHAAQPQADRINALAAERKEDWLPRYGGRTSSEWMQAKALQLLEEAPEIYAAADRVIEAGDWLVWQLTGQEKRNACAAGYKGLWVKGKGWPSDDFLKALNPAFESFTRDKIHGPIQAADSRAGTLTAEAAQWTGLREGTAVSMCIIDAHAAVAGCGVWDEGRMVIIMGTSSCHMLLGTAGTLVPGISGVVEDGILGGFYGYEAGQAGVGDLFQWLVENLTPASYFEEAQKRDISIYQLLGEKAAAQKVGEHGLLALDWLNGNRSVLVDATLSGLLVGMTLGTRAHDIYRALMEGTAYGTNIIIDTFEKNGVPVKEIVVCGGLAEKNQLMVQIYADVTGREITVAGAPQACALGAAMLGAVAAGQQAGGYDTIQQAVEKMASPAQRKVKPDAARGEAYRALFAEYVTLHDTFGRSVNPVMKKLRALRQ